MRILLSKIASLFTQAARSDAADRAELEAHLDLLTQRFQQQGLSPTQARRAARRQFGSSDLHQQNLRDQRRPLPLTNLARDLRFAARRLRKSPGFALTAILTLALGIGASTAIFSIVDGVLLKPLAYRNSAQLTILWERVRYLEKLFPHTGANPRHEQIWEQHATAFSGITLFQERTVPVGLADQRPFLTARILAEPNLLDVLQIQPFLGRDFLPSDAIKGHNNVAILTWPLWQSLFQGDPNVLGRTFHLAGDVIQVIGVLPRSFYFPRSREIGSGASTTATVETGLLMPLAGNISDMGGWNSDYGNYTALGRLKPGVTPAQAEAQLNTIDDGIVRQMPPNETDGGNPAGELTSYVQSFKDVVVDSSKRALWLLFAAVLSLLLIACINLANAQLARAAVRDREVAVRSALGASAGSLLQAAFAETLLLSLAGSAFGILAASIVVHRISTYTALPLPRTAGLSLNPTVLTLSLVLTVGAAMLVGLLPALRQLRVRPQQALQNSTRTTGSRHSYLLRRWLVGTQIFACTVLLLVTGLFASSLARLLSADKGFSPSHVLSVETILPTSNNSDAVWASFDDALLAKLRALPGVQHAALVSRLLQGDTWIDGVIRPDRSQNTNLANYRWISPDYFATLQQHIVQGRDLNDHDREIKGAVISQATAKAIWPGLDPIGRPFLAHGGREQFTVVGIVADAHVNSLRAPPPSMVYLPYWDNPGDWLFLIRSTQDPMLLANAVRHTIWDYNPAIIIPHIQTLSDQIGDTLSPERLETTILTAFGISALLLALLGIYGTLSYSVATRRQEIGVRMALGASRTGIYTNTLREIALPLTIGLALGYLASLAIGRTIAALLYNTAPTDPIVALAVITLFLIAAAASTILPCRRAAHTNPSEALRAE